VIALGVIQTAEDPSVSITTDRARRMSVVAAELARIATAHGVEAIIAEEPLGFGSGAAVAANQLPWGAVVMLAVSRGYQLHMVTARTWQYAVLGIEPIDPRTRKAAKVDYEQVKRALAAYLGERDYGVPVHVRNHAYDAAGIGMLLALRPEQATRIIERNKKLRRLA